MLDSVAEMSKEIPRCSYVRGEDLIARTRANLLQHIAGQREGIDELIGCLEAWELSKEDGVSSEPLVMAITGPTGVGKSETGYRVAEAILAPASSSSWTDILKLRRGSGGVGSAVDTPGLLVIQGGDFSSGALAFYGGSVALVSLEHDAADWFFLRWLHMLFYTILFFCCTYLYILHISYLCVL